VQRLTFGAQPAAGSNFTLSLQLPNNVTVTTAPIAVPSPFDATQLATNIQNALTANGVLGAGNATVTSASATQFDVTFKGTYALVNMNTLGVPSNTTGTTLLPTTTTDGSNANAVVTPVSGSNASFDVLF